MKSRFCALRLHTRRSRVESIVAAAIVGAAILMSSLGCSVWVAREARELGVEAHPPRLSRVNRTYLLADATVAYDSIVGYSLRPMGDGFQRGHRVAFALRDVHAFEERRLAKTRTVLLAASVALAAFLLTSPLDYGVAVPINWSLHDRS